MTGPTLIEPVGAIAYPYLVDYQATEALRERHPAWRLLRAGNAALILSFLGGYFGFSSPLCG